MGALGLFMMYLDNSHDCLRHPQALLGIYRAAGHLLKQ